MRGLEIAELPYYRVRSDNRVFRIDGQYFGKTALSAEARIKRGSWKELLDIASDIESFGAYSLTNLIQYLDEGVPFLRCVNIKDGFADFTDVLFISPGAHKLLWKSAVRPGMMLLTMSGSVGNTTVAQKDWPYPVNSNQDIAKITPKAGVSVHYLAAFFNSRYGQIQLERIPVGSVQQHVFLWMIEKLTVPRFSDGLEGNIADVVKAAYAQQGKANASFGGAASILADTLGLANWHPPDPLTYTRHASEVFAARRVDSLYFSPRVSQLLQVLARDNARIGDVAPARHEEFVAGSSGEFDYIEISDIQADGTAASNRLPQSEAPSRATWYVRPGDVLASTVRPIRRLSAIVAPEQDSFVCSSGFVVLAPQTVSPELFLTYLRLPQVCELMDLHTSASMYPAISEGDLLNLPFRRIPSDVERKIVAAVRRSHSARREARNLLDRAKRAVEIAIEQSEASALRSLSETVT